LAGKKKTDIRTSKEHERPPRRPQTKKKKSSGKMPKRKKKHEGKKPNKSKEEGSKARSLKDSTKFDHQLRSKHPVHTLKVGSVGANVARTTGDTLTDLQKEAVASRLRVACVILQRLRRHAFWACGLQIDKILKQGGTPESRKADLDEILDGDSFGKTLATILLSGEPSSNSAYARALKKGEAVKQPLSLETFTLFSETTGLSGIRNMPLKLEDVPGADPSKFTLTRASELVMAQVQSSLRCHYRNAEVGHEPNERQWHDLQFVQLT
jgi:hypothetical protein